MSVQAITWAFEQDVKPAGAKLLLIGLANYSNDKFECWPSKTTLAAKCSMSKSTVCKYLRQLQDNALLSVTERTANEGRQISSVITLNVSSTVRLTDRGCPSDGQGVSEGGDRGLSDCADTNHHIEPSIEPFRRKPGKRPSYPAPFEAFWKAYPKDPNMSKVEAFDEWKKLSPEDQEKATASLPNFKRYCAKDPDYKIIHACRYLKKRRFDGFAPTVTSEVDDTAWIKRLEYARQKRCWFPSEWKGLPGEPGCAVPKHLLLPTDGQGWSMQERIAA
jgi:hypothetical protein